MSRIGRKPVSVPAGVTVKAENGIITVSGPKGTLVQDYDDKVITVKVENNEVVLTRANEVNTTRAKHGLYRALVSNMVKGVTDGYEKVLIIEGTGYKAELKNGGLELSLGFSHKINVAAPAGITFTVPKITEIHVAGIDKEVVGQIAAEIRGYKRPEPYHGKGIHYSDEKVRRKEIKKAGK